MNHDNWTQLDALADQLEKVIPNLFTDADVEDGGRRLEAMSRRLIDLGQRLLGSANVAAIQQEEIRGTQQGE